jgi:phosphoribosylglycinamide formyltransferase-1
MEAIYDAIAHGSLDAELSLILSSNPEAPALEFAQTHDIQAFAIPRRADGQEIRTAFILEKLKSHGITFIALAGYMHLLEKEVVRAYTNRIVNIHPALLPSFGGKGMYGHYVHEAVLESGAKVSGATVHIVDEEYDRGPIVAQRVVPVLSDDSPATLAERVLRVEHSLYPEALQLFAEDRVTVKDRTTKIIGTSPAYMLA